MTEERKKKQELMLRAAEIFYDVLVDGIEKGMLNEKDFFLVEEKGSAMGDIPEKESTKNGKITEKVESKLVIEHEGRTYSRFNPCKYKCGMWSSFANDYKKGDRPIHINPVTKEVLGGCPKYE